MSRGCPEADVQERALRALREGRPLPTAKETPSRETDKTVTPSPHHPLGAKGVVE